MPNKTENKEMSLAQFLLVPQNDGLLGLSQYLDRLLENRKQGDG